MRGLAGPAACAMLALWVGVAPGAAASACRQALALGLDVSGSVDAREYRLQIHGVADALSDPRVRQALLSMPETPVRLLVYEWSGSEDQAIILPWTAIDSAPALDAAIATLRATRRRDASPGTALGVAMTRGAALLATQDDCWRRTLDLSGDGKSNFGPRPRDVKDALVAAGNVTINALAIGVDNPATGDIRQAEIAELSSYFRAEVILGPGAFVHTALGFEDYARALAEKLLRELDGIVLSRLEAAPQ